MIIERDGRYIEAEFSADDIIYVTYGSMGEDGHVAGTTERLGHFLDGHPYPTTEEELRVELERIV